MKALCLWLSLFTLFDRAFANTEIVNFSASEDTLVDLPFTGSWPVLNRVESSIQINATSAKLGSVLPHTICPDIANWKLEELDWCPHEIWVVLDLDETAWQKFDRFTLRLSWAAFNPTDISMKIFDPVSMVSFSGYNTAKGSTTTRRKYARIQLVHTGVLTPTANNISNVLSRYQVPFVLKLEPLHFGVLPASVAPIIYAILAAIAVGLPISIKINSYLQTIVLQAKTKVKTQ